MEGFCKTICWLELHFDFPPKVEQECAEPFYVVMTHHTAKANLEKGSFWPPETAPYGLWHIRGLTLTKRIRPTPWTRPQTIAPFYLVFIIRS